VAASGRPRLSRISLLGGNVQGMQHSGGQVLGQHPAILGVAANAVRGPVDLTTCTPPPASATDKTLPQWVPTAGAVDLRRAAKLSIQTTQRLVQQTAFAEILQQGRVRLNP